jgi:hypothetical protein
MRRAASSEKPQRRKEKWCGAITGMFAFTVPLVPMTLPPLSEHARSFLRNARHMTLKEMGTADADGSRVRAIASPVFRTHGKEQSIQ